MTARPWTLVTSVYAPAGPAHLLGDVVALAVVGHATGLACGLVAGRAGVLDPPERAPSLAVGVR